MSSRSRGPYRPGHYQAPEAPAHRQRPEHAKRDSYDWATLWIAGIGVFIVAVSAVIQAWAGWQGQQQVGATRRQLEMMAAQDRPWVSPDIPSGGNLWISKPNAVLGYDLPLKNTGQVAATEVRVEVAVMGDPVEGDAMDYSVPALKLCERTKAGPSEAMYPGETKILGQAAPVNLLSTKNLIHKYDGGFYMTPVIVGCITYRSPTDGQMKRTPFAFEVIDPNWKRNNRHWRFIKALRLSGHPHVDFERATSGGGDPN